MSYHKAEQFNLPLSEADLAAAQERAYQRENKKPSRQQTIAEARVVQKKCQRGVSGYGRALYENANELAADCYGTIGRLIAIIEGEI